MPVYGIPGASTTPRRARLVGLAAIGIAVVIALVVQMFGGGSSAEDTMTVTLRAATVGDGIVPGAEVRLRGVAVGVVDSVAPTAGGDQTITVGVRRGEVPGITDALKVSYAPSNLFGISALVLEPGTGGAALVDGGTVDVTAAGRTTDATMGSLLRQLSDTTNDVLTPELTGVLKKLGENARGFAPLLESIVAVSRSVADTQKYPVPFLIEQYAKFLDGTAVFGDGFIKLIERVYGIPIMRNERPQLNDGVTLIANEAFPAISTLLNTANRRLNNYAGVLAVTVGQLARTVPDPTRSHAELIEIFRRLDATFRESPGGGRTVGVDVLVRGMPGLAVPLLGGAVPANGGRP